MELNAHITEETAKKIEVFFQIEKEEYKAISWLDSFFGSTSTIRLTEFLAESCNYNINKTQTIFRRNRFHIYWPKFFIAFWVGIFAISVITSWETDIRSVYNLLLSFTILLFILIQFTAFNRQSDEEMSFQILITPENIQVKNRSYTWADILDTYIVQRPNGRGKSYFLIIAFTNGKYIRFDITQHRNLFSDTTEMKLAKAIEYYKAQAQRFTPQPSSPVSTSGILHSP
jgi:hypothetical protein